MGIALAGIAAVVAAVLLVPLTVDLSIAKGADGAASAVVRFRWFGLSFGGGPTAAAPAPRRLARRPAARRRSRYGWASLRAALGSPGFLRRCARLLSSIGRIARPDRLSLRGRIGFDDPAETGMFLGWLYATSATGSPRRRWLVRIEPDFSGPTFEGRADLHWSRSLGAVLWPLVTFSASPAVWRAWFRARLARVPQPPR